jgi:hypothetical protein
MKRSATEERARLASLALAESAARPDYFLNLQLSPAQLVVLCANAQAFMALTADASVTHLVRHTIDHIIELLRDQRMTAVADLIEFQYLYYQEAPWREAR